MKWIWTLILAALTVTGVNADEGLEFPFNRATRITFIRLGDTQTDAGQQFVLEYKNREWIVERRISRTEFTTETIAEEKAQQMISAFSELYDHWNTKPYFNTADAGYSLFISIKGSWQMALRVKDRGSPALTQLIETIAYPEGLKLEGVPKDKRPGEIRASTIDDPQATSTD